MITHRYTAFFSLWMSIFIVLSINLYQIGFETPIGLLLRSVGMLAIIIYLPIYFFAKPHYWWQNHSFGSFVVLVLLSGLGYLCRFLPFLSNISYLLAGIGMILWFKAIFNDLKNFSWKKNIAGVLLGALLGTYLLAYFYSRSAHSALYEEVIAFFGSPNEVLLDSIYHSAVAKMIQTYQVLTTGVEGVVPMNYNVVSHWIFAQLSLLLETDILRFYHLVNPVIVFPFFMYAFLSLVSQVYTHLSEKVFHKSTPKLFSISSWIVFLCLFFPIPDSIYARGLLGLHFVQSLTYPLALTFLWCFGSLCLSYFQKPNHRVLFLWLIFPCSVFIIGYTHVAMGVAILAATGYLFLRFKLFLSPTYWAWIFLQAGILFVTYWLTAETNFAGQSNSHEGSFQWFFFFRQEGFVWWDFLVGLYLPLAIISVLYWQKFRLKGLIDNKMIFLEIIWAVALGGLAPNIILALYGSTGMYFMSTQRLLAGLLLLAYIPFLEDFWLFWTKKYAQYIGAALILGFVLVFYMSYRNTLNNSWSDNLKARKHIMQIEDFNWKANHFIEKAFSDDKDWLKAKKLFSKDIQKKVAQNDYIKFIHAIQSLDKLPISEKSQSLLYIPFHKIRLRHFDSTIVCAQTPMHLTALSGLALVGGLPKPSCGVGAYGYSYLDFTLRDKAWKDGLSKEELTQIAQKRGFKYVYCFKPEDYSYEKIVCQK